MKTFNPLEQAARDIRVEHEVRELFGEAEFVPCGYQPPTDRFERPTEMFDGHLMIGDGYDVAKAVHGEPVAVYHPGNKNDE
ncbi:hypothetical protein HZC30_07060 [Candidatus Woesearchaeota archaeon]|nr:hypothetical protein [Candidatus Woesearchaeota archaeon]